MTNLNRRALLAAGAAGLFGTALPALHAHTGRMTDAEFAALAKAPLTAKDFKRLARHLETLAKEAGAEATIYENVAALYRKEGIAGATRAQALDAARALEHVAGHHRDVTEALEHLFEAYDGLAENAAVISG
jgi:IS5 family transposase